MRDCLKTEFRGSASPASPASQGGRRLARGATSLLLLIGAVQLLTTGGCADQGEGERCTFFSGGDAGENGSDECASGLVCKSTTYYAGTNVLTGLGTLGVCCPPPGTASTYTACNPPPGGSTNGGKPTGDGSFDAPVDAGHDGALPDGHHEDGALDGKGSSDGHHADGAIDGKGADASHLGDAHGEASKDATHDAPHSG